MSQKPIPMLPPVGAPVPMAGNSDQHLTLNNEALLAVNQANEVPFERT